MRPRNVQGDLVLPALVIRDGSVLHRCRSHPRRSLAPGVVVLLLVALAFVASAASVALAEAPGDEHWWSGFEFQFLTGPAYTLCVHDGKLYAGGDFVVAGNVVASNTAWWDGRVWNRLGLGTGGNWPLVYAMTTFGDRLVAAGGFTWVDGLAVNAIAAWDGTRWGALGAGLGGWVQALAVFQGDLIAGGKFSTAGGQPANHIARWDGSSWHPLGAGLDGDVLALAVYGGQLIAAGRFFQAGGVAADNIAAWDGNSWHPLGLGVDSYVQALTIYNGRLVAGGDFAHAGAVNAAAIATWDGTTWAALGQGFGPVTEEPSVRALTVYNGDLIAGGGYFDPPRPEDHALLRWNGSSWAPLGSGLQYGSLRTWVRSLVVKDGSLYVGGDFHTAGDKWSPGIARWYDVVPSGPGIQRTDETIALSDRTWAEGTRFQIDAHITNGTSAASTILYYKNSSASNYTNVAMQVVQGDIYRGVIPSAAVSAPGVDYYITATEGGFTTVDPPTAPTIPYSLAVSANPAPTLTQVLPQAVLSGDSGVDVVLLGEGLEPGATILIDSDYIHQQYGSCWGPQQFHVNVTVESGTPSGDIAIRVKNPDGQVSNSATLHIRAAAVPAPSQFAPILWFSGGERWRPTTPLFAATDGSTQYTSTDERIAAYNSLSQDAKLRQATVYYRVYGDDSGEGPIWYPRFPLRCLVYEYWFFCVFDDFALCGLNPLNRHQLDWERFFVFVDAEAHTVRAIVGSAHTDHNINNVYEFPPPYPGMPYHATVLVEEGSHALCPDMDSSGVFDRAVDVRHDRAKLAWGIRDGIDYRYPDAKLFPSPLAGPSDVAYRLTALDGLQQVIEAPALGLSTTLRNLWSGSRDERCVQCALSPVWRASWWEHRALTTMRTSGLVSVADSPTHPNRLAAQLAPRCVAVFGASEPCWDTRRPLLLGHAPPKHPWLAEDFSDPAAILPGGNTVIAGEILGASDECGGVALLAGTTVSASSGLSSSAGIPVVAYAPIGENGAVGFTNLEEGVYTFALELSGVAPFQQTIRLDSSTVQLGVNGVIRLLPEDRSFTLHVQVSDHVGGPVPEAEVRFVSEPDSLVLVTMTDSLGSAWLSADTRHSYQTTVRKGELTDVRRGSRGARGDTIVVQFALSTPVTVEDMEVDVTGSRARLRWRLHGITDGSPTGVRVERAPAPQGPYVSRTIHPLVPAAVMAFEDSLAEGVVWWYRLVLQRTEGESVVGPWPVPMGAVAPLGLRLEILSRPGEHGPVIVQFTVASARTPVRLDVFSIAGRRVRSMDHAVYDPGAYLRAWDRRDVRGERVARGVYVVQLRAGSVHLERKVVLLGD